MAKSSLHTKLAAIRAEFGPIQKTGEMKEGPRFKYVEAQAIAARFVELASEKSLTMLPVGMTVRDVRPTVSGKQNVITLESQWQITDAETGEFIIVAAVGEGADQSDKGAPKAQTNCLKYAILLVLQAAGDDPERDPASNDAGEVSDKAAAAEARTAARRAARNAPQATATTFSDDPTMARGLAGEPVSQEAAAVPRPTEQAAPVEQPATVTETVTTAEARGPRATKMASDALKAAIWARSHEVGLDEFQLKAMARTLTGKESSKDWTQRDGEKVRAKLDSEATVELFKDMKAVAE